MQNGSTKMKEMINNNNDSNNNNNGENNTESVGYETKKKATIAKTTGWCLLLWHFYQEIRSDLRVKEILIITIIIKIMIIIIVIIIAITEKPL